MTRHIRFAAVSSLIIVVLGVMTYSSALSRTFREQKDSYEEISAQNLAYQQIIEQAHVNARRIHRHAIARKISELSSRNHPSIAPARLAQN